MTVDELVDKLARPIYNLRMARALENSPNPSMRKSARTRAANARKEIADIVNTGWSFDPRNRDR